MTVPRRTLLLVAVAVLANLLALRNGFAYDDVWIIARNARVHDATWTAYFAQTYWNDSSGLGLYRPLAIFGYAVQWVLGDGQPWLFHAVNLALHAAVTALVHRLGLLLVPPTGALVAALLFAVHPVHVEAVANVVGQAELWVALCVLAGLVRFLEARRRGPLTDADAVTIAGLGFIGILFKEHAVILPVAVVAAEWLVVAADRPWRARLRGLLPYLVLTGLLLGVYFSTRITVLGDITGDSLHPMLRGTTLVERARIMLGIVPEWGRLLLWPARLMADYSPREVTVFPWPDRSQLNGAVAVVLLTVLWLVARRAAPGAAFALLLGGLALGPSANLLLPTGILAAERTLYLPSAGVLLALGAGVPWLVRRTARAGAAGTGVLRGTLAALVLAGALASNDRARSWQDSPTVFRQLLLDAPRSFKAHYAYGGLMFEQRRAREGEREWRYAIALAPEVYDMYVDLGHRYREAHICPAAIPLYRTALELEPVLPPVRGGLVACHLELAQWRTARAEARAAVKMGFDRRSFTWLADRADSALVANDSGDAVSRRRWRARVSR